MNNQVLSIEQCKELVSKGIDMSNASMCYFIGAIEELLPIYGPVEYSENEYVPTFTLQDILEMLPSYKITYDKYTRDIDRYEIRIDIPEGQHYITHIAQSSESLLEAAFKMLKWCKQYNYI